MKRPEALALNNPEWNRRLAREARLLPPPRNIGSMKRDSAKAFWDWLHFMSALGPRRKAMPIEREIKL